LNALYLYGGAVLYGFYLIYDTQILIGGKKKELSMDDYILGAMLLYMDIIALFLRILKILNKLQGEEGKNKKKK